MRCYHSHGQVSKSTDTSAHGCHNENQSRRASFPAQRETRKGRRHQTTKNCRREANTHAKAQNSQHSCFIMIFFDFIPSAVWFQEVVVSFCVVRRMRTETKRRCCRRVNNTHTYEVYSRAKHLSYVFLALYIFGISIWYLLPILDDRIGRIEARKPHKGPKSMVL